MPSRRYTERRNGGSTYDVRGLAPAQLDDLQEGVRLGRAVLELHRHDAEGPDRQRAGPRAKPHGGSFADKGFGFRVFG